MIGIIGAMEDEIRLLHSSMTTTETKKEAGFEFITGTLEGAEVILLRSGIGKVNAAVGCALLLQLFKPGLLINTGSAGGLDAALSIGDIVISDGLVYHDADVTAFHYKPGQIPGMPQIFPVAEKFLSMAEKAADELKNEKIFPQNLNHARGLIGSGDVFMHQKERIDGVRRSFPGIKAVEMEGAAIAHTCHLFGIPALIIRSLSDIAGAESTMTFDEFLPLASKNSAELVRRIIRIAEI